MKRYIKSSANKSKYAQLKKVMAAMQNLQNVIDEMDEDVYGVFEAAVGDIYTPISDGIQDLSAQFFGK